MTKKLGEQQFSAPPSGKQPKQDARQLGHYMAITSQNVGVIAIFGILGWFLDKKLDTEPYLLVCSLLVGAAVGFYQLIRSSIQSQQDNAKK